MKTYRITIDIDIRARDRGQAGRRANLIVGDIEAGRREWIVEILPDGTQERPTAKGA
ncbi:hypothetical protein AB1L88_16735 [Tautonia sp. JC769]|uniref:hypothetical protein n=1 Tax=Tautonia sp. JC769 TaxID=3232135 RepID=UPI00345AF547